MTQNNNKEKENQQASPSLEQQEAELASMFNLKSVKKKKKKLPTKKEANSNLASPQPGSPSCSPETTTAQQPAAGLPYSYKDLLNRAMLQVTSSNPSHGHRRRFTLQPPKLARLPKKSIWINFSDTCSAMHRSPEHLFQFVTAELGTDASIDGNRRLVLRGKFTPSSIESLLRKYIVEYVTCQMCRSFNTTLTRDNVSRLFFNQCQECGSSRSVAPIRAGYHAQTKADRRAIKNAT